MPIFGILRTTPSSTLESVWPMFTRRTKSVAAGGNNQYGQTISPLMEEILHLGSLSYMLGGGGFHELTVRMGTCFRNGEI